MARTPADMTPEEREQCRGLWCDYLTVNGEVIQVIYRWEKDGLASVHDPKTQDERTNQYVMVRSLTPRFDLMRAWTPDGTPVVMSQEWAARLESGGASITRTRDEAEQAHARHRERHENYGTGSYDMLEPQPPAPAGIQHRFTTEWEAADE